MAPEVATRVAFKNILFATDFSEVSWHALLHALAIAKRYHAKLIVVHVAAPEAATLIPMEPVPLELDWQKKKGAERLARLEDFEPLHMYLHETILKQGNPWLEMSGIIEGNEVGLIVMGRHGRGMIGRVSRRAGAAARDVPGADRGPLCIAPRRRSRAAIAHPVCHRLLGRLYACLSLCVVPGRGERRRTYPDARNGRIAADAG